MDWFFLSYFGKPIGYWRNLTEDKISVIMTLENERQKEYWDNWITIIGKIFKK